MFVVCGLDGEIAPPPVIRPPHPRSDPVSGREVAAELERYRGWLALLARLQVERTLPRKFDQSGHRAADPARRPCRGWRKFRGATDAELTAWLPDPCARVAA